jgi:glycosyltransferase involved in cell wall biosynthesis
MKIAIMMRAMDQDSGFRAITEHLVEAMLRVGTSNSYLLLYRTAKWFGRFAKFGNAKEVVIKAPHKIAWDQVAVPFKAWNEGVDVIFNPKFSIPLISHCPVAMGLQEPAWWVWPQHYERWNVWYQKIMMPLYCRKALHLFPNSEFILQENQKYLPLSVRKCTIVYSAPGAHFRPIDDRAVLKQTSGKYDLPERFILSVTRVDHPGLENSTSFHGGKNVETAVRAFNLIREHIPHTLVIAGRRVREYLAHAGLSHGELKNVRILGFVPREEMANLYNLAEIFVIPSFYEGCPSTLLEAMACGLPVVGSETGACPDVSGGAAIFANPYDPADFAEKMMQMLKNSNMRQEFKAKSLARASQFSWEISAKLILNALARAITYHSKLVDPVESVSA